MTFTELRRGQKVGSYTLERSTGSGSCGEVWRASSGSRLVAIKFLNAQLLNDPQVDRHSQRMAQEAATLERLGKHPNIPSLLDRDLNSARPYLVMQHVSGPAWNELIASGEILCLPLRRRLELLRAVAQAIRVVHLAGYLHRDIKPSNIHGIETPYLLDFSVAIDKRDVSAGMRRVGTRAYMPPGDGSPPDERDDTYAFALVTYEVLFGRHAFDSPLVEGDKTEEYEPASSAASLGRWKRPGDMANHELPQALRGADLRRLDTIFERALGSRLWRYKSATMLIQHLEDAILIPANEPYIDFVPDVAVALAFYVEEEDDFTFHEVRSRAEQSRVSVEPEPAVSGRGWRGSFFAPFLVVALAVLALMMAGA